MCQRKTLTLPTLLHLQNLPIVNKYLTIGLYYANMLAHTTFG